MTLRQDYDELLDIATKLVNWCDENPPAGESLYFVQLARNAVARINSNRRKDDSACKLK